ncbi:MAG: DUF6249 domain-containing protein [Casimicrobiaceae bacterium]
MHPATLIAAATPPRLVRRLVLGGAFLLALTIALAPRVPAVHAQETKQPAPPAAPAPPKATGTGTPSLNATIKDGEGASATVDIQVDKGNKSVTFKKSITLKPDAADTVDEDADTTGTIIGVGPGKHGKRVRVGVFGDDREYDSFNDFVHAEPGLSAMIVMIVAIVFLSPVLVIALFFWYRMRRARMMNETMLKLAEKGVMPPAEALNALTGNSPAALAEAPSTAPFYEQAKQIRRRAAWSDLRKGVLLGGFGLGLTFYSMLDDGSPNGLGLVLFFVGIGYIVLWWFEERQAAPKGIGTAAMPPAPPSGGTDGVA